MRAPNQVAFHLPDKLVVGTNTEIDVYLGIDAEGIKIYTGRERNHIYTDAIKSDGVKLHIYVDTQADKKYKHD